MNSSGGYRVHAWNSEGIQPLGWPKSTGGWNIASPAIGDMDGDGTFDVAISSRNGWVFVWSTPGSSDGIVEWQSFGHDHHNTNNYNTPIPIYGTVGSGPAEVPEEERNAVADEDTAGATDEEAESADTTDSVSAEDDATAQDESAPTSSSSGGGGCHTSVSHGIPWLLLVGFLLAWRRKTLH